MIFKDGLQRYSIAVLAALAATQLRHFITFWADDHIPLGTYLMAVVMVAWLAGTGPAILSLVLGTGAAIFCILPAEGVQPFQDPNGFISPLIYGLVGAITIGLFHIINRQNELTRGQLRQIRKLSRELKTSDRNKDEFLALLAHELRNPLAPIRSGLTLLQEESLDLEARNRINRTMCKQMRQLIRIVDDLLDVSRYLHGKITLERATIDLRDVVETAIDQAQPEFNDRQQEVQLLMPAQPVPVDGDLIRLVQIVTNLLTNAAKYTPRAGRIQILLECQSEQALLSVTDNGIGITRDMQDKIFELFARSDAAINRDHGGLGLGLPIAKQFAEMHGGTLQVVSDGADLGSRFELTLPLLPAASWQQRSTRLNSPILPQRADFEPPPKPQTDDSAGSESPRVLIVDDNVDAAETLATLLSFDGFEACSVYDGFQALRKAQEFRPDIVLLDIGLPGMDGHEVARRLREELLLQPLTLIAVTGWGGEEDLAKSAAAGINHHLVKPVDPAQLSQIMHAAITGGDAAVDALRSTPSI